MEYKRLTDSETAEMLKNTKGESWDSGAIEVLRYIRLAELEDKIEDGTLIELPCKEWNPAYFITQDEDGNEEIVRTHHWEWAVFARICGKPYYSMQGDQIFEYGEDVFATREEAEARLKELMGK